MELVINIPEKIYEASQVMDVKYEDVIQIPLEVIANGTPLPKGHGRLVDADAFKKKVCTYQQTGCGDCKHSLCCPEDVPTIIEASSEEE